MLHLIWIVHSILIWFHGFGKVFFLFFLHHSLDSPHYFLFCLEKSQFTLSWAARQTLKQIHWKYTFGWWSPEWQWKSTFSHWHFVNLQRAMPMYFCGQTCSCPLFISIMVPWDTGFQPVSQYSAAVWWMMWTMPGLLSLSIISLPISNLNVIYLWGKRSNI